MLYRAVRLPVFSGHQIRWSRSGSRAEGNMSTLGKAVGLRSELLQKYKVQMGRDSPGQRTIQAEKHKA